MLDFHSGSCLSFPTEECLPCPRSYFIEPAWERFSALLPGREVVHPRLSVVTSTESPSGYSSIGSFGSWCARLRLPRDRRRALLGPDAAPPTRRADRPGGDGRFAREMALAAAYDDRSIGLEPADVEPRGGLHHQGPVRRAARRRGKARRIGESKASPTRSTGRWMEGHPPRRRVADPAGRHETRRFRLRARIALRSRWGALPEQRSAHIFRIALTTLTNTSRVSV
jgi:hypothetical protein